MTLFEKIIRIYPDIDPKEFSLGIRVRLQNDSDGKGDYIAIWDHPDYPRPTQEQLDAITE